MPPRPAARPVSPPAWTIIWQSPSDARRFTPPWRDGLRPAAHPLAPAQAPGAGGPHRDPAAPSEPILDGATLDALRALPRSGTKGMLEHIGELYLLDSRALIASIEESLGAGNSADLARA